MKWLGALLLVLSGWWMGWSRVSALRRELRQTQQLWAWVRQLENELRQRGTPLPELLEGCHRYGLPTERWAKALREGKTALQAGEPWLKSLEPGLEVVLAPLFSVLGRYDSFTQAEACATAEQALIQRCDGQKRQLEEKARIYRTVPLTLGLMAALVLL